jgi:hypothetical protein
MRGARMRARVCTAGKKSAGRGGEDKEMAAVVGEGLMGINRSAPRGRAEEGRGKQEWPPPGNGGEGWGQGGNADFASGRLKPL